jgi:hypothetical protein
VSANRGTFGEKRKRDYLRRKAATHGGGGDGGDGGVSRKLDQMRLQAEKDDLLEELAGFKRVDDKKTRLGFLINLQPVRETNQRRG